MKVRELNWQNWKLENWNEKEWKLEGQFCIFAKYLKEKKKRAQAKPTYGGKKKKRPMNGADCQIIVKIL